MGCFTDELADWPCYRYNFEVVLEARARVTDAKSELPLEAIATSAKENEKKRAPGAISQD